MDHPIKRGRVVRWEGVQQLWTRAFQHLRTSPTDQPILITQPTSMTSSDREKTMQMLFEDLEVPAMYLALQPMLSLFAYGHTTGISVDIGAEVSHCVPIFNCSPLHYAAMSSDIAGNDLDEAMLVMLQGRFPKEAISVETARDVKERLCCVAQSYEEVLWGDGAKEEKLFQLPSGDVVSIGRERFLCSEVLFSYSDLGKKTLKLPELVSEAIGRLDIDVRGEMMGSVFLSGGTSLVPGLAERVKREIQRKRRWEALRVFAHKERKHSAWIGGAMLASLPFMTNMWVPIDDYNEVGPLLVHRKCY
uniref:Actin n=1 Tax=Arcella intermedia TaxID=1963864 RepID=A0A6B2LAT3_9EUKA